MPAPTRFNATWLRWPTALVSALAFTACLACGPYDESEDYVMPGYISADTSRSGNISALFDTYIANYHDRRYESYGYAYGEPTPDERRLTTLVSQLNGKLGTTLVLPHQITYSRWPYFHCRSNYIRAAGDFLESLLIDAEPVDADTVAALWAARLEIFSLCGDKSREQLPAVLSPFDAIYATGKMRDHQLYLQAIAHFYTNQFDQSGVIFNQLTASASPWVQEVATYMLGRNQLAQGYRQPTPPARAPTPNPEQTVELFLAYAAKFPQGKYTDSARNIIRQVYAHSGQSEKLDSALAKLVADQQVSAPPPEHDTFDHRLWEVAEQYTGQDAPDYTNPLMIAAKLLTAGPNGVDLSQVDAHADLYTPFPGLLDFVRVYHQHHTGNHPFVQSYRIGTTARNTVVTATLALKAQSFETEEKWRDAAAAWSQAFQASGDGYAGGQAIVGYLRADDPAGIFSGALGEDPYLAQLARNDLLFDDQLTAVMNSPAIAAKQRNLAGQALLQRHLIRQDYQQFLDTYKTLTDVGIYAQVQTAVTTLVRDKHNSTALMNVGYFMLHHKIRDQRLPRTRAPFTEEIDGYHKSAIIKPAKPPYDYFLEVIRRHDNGRKSVAEAKSLHFIIHCFTSHWTKDACLWNKTSTWEEKPMPDTYAPKRWFKRLHSKYPESEWAEKTKYYY